MEADRRTAPRLLRRLEVLVAGELSHTADVTANGLCIETTHLALPGTSLNGSVVVDGRVFHFVGMVCWARGDHMGVRFIEVAREFADALH